MNVKSASINTVKSISLTVSLLLGIIPVCLAEDLPAESLVIKGVHLGMSEKECDNIAIECFGGSKVDRISFKKTAFSNEEFEVSTIFVENLIAAYKIPLYFNKIVKRSFLETHDEHPHLFPYREKSYCIISDIFNAISDTRLFLECNNKITGIKLEVRSGDRNQVLVITKVQNINEIEKAKREEEMKNQEAGKSVKFN